MASKKKDTTIETPQTEVLDTLQPVPQRLPGAKLLQVYDNFSGGEYGEFGGLNAPANSFTGLNVLRYMDGSLGPRCGLLDLAVSSVANGVLKGIGWTGTSGGDVWYCTGTTIYKFDADNTGSSITSYTNSLASTPTLPLDSYDTSQTSYIVNYGDKAYKLVHNTSTVTALSSAPGGRCIAIYGDRMVIGGTSGNLNRVFYSAPGDFTSWPSTNYFDVGADAWQVVGLYPMREFLLIVKQDGSFWALTGTPGVNDSLRRIYGPKDSGHPYGFNPQRGVLLHNQQFWFVPNYGSYPAYFTGARANDLRQLIMNTYGATVDQVPPQYGLSQIEQDDEIAFFYPSGALIYSDGIWTHHTFDVTITGFVAQRSFGRIVIGTAGGASTAPKFYSWTVKPGWDGGGATRPPIKSQGASSQERVGDTTDTAPNCQFTLPEWHAAPGSEVQVRHVIVDFDSYNTAVSATNNFDLIVNALDVYERSSPQAASTQSFNEATASSSSSGTRRSKLFSFAPDRGRGFSINLQNIRGCKIRRISVYGVVEPARVA